MPSSLKGSRELYSFPPSTYCPSLPDSSSSSLQSLQNNRQFQALEDNQGKSVCRFLNSHNTVLNLLQSDRYQRSIPVCFVRTVFLKLCGYCLCCNISTQEDGIILFFTISQTKSYRDNDSPAPCSSCTTLCRRSDWINLFSASGSRTILFTIVLRWESPVSRGKGSSW